MAPLATSFGNAAAIMSRLSSSEKGFFRDVLAVAEPMPTTTFTHLSRAAWTSILCPLWKGWNRPTTSPRTPAKRGPPFCPFLSQGRALCPYGDGLGGGRARGEQIGRAHV